MQTYGVDSYNGFAASGIAAAVVLRSWAGFGFPLSAPYIYDTLGYGWGNRALGFVGIVTCDRNSGLCYLLEVRGKAEESFGICGWIRAG